MTQTQRTPGKWHRNGNQIVSIHTDEDGDHETLICDVFDQHDWWRANARLIAAAPALLAAVALLLDDMLEGLEDAAMFDESIGAARAALATATGKPY